VLNALIAIPEIVIPLFLLFVFCAAHVKQQEEEFAREYKRRNKRHYKRFAEQVYSSPDDRGTSLASGRSKDADEAPDESEYVDGTQRWGDLFDSPGLHDSGGGFDCGGPGWS